MGSSFVMYERVILFGFWIAKLKILKIEGDLDFPDGFKVKFILLRKEEGHLKEHYVLIDNHPPIGYHHHPRLPDEHNDREALDGQNREEALEFFLKKVQEITGEDIKDRL